MNHSIKKKMSVFVAGILLVIYIQQVHAEYISGDDEPLKKTIQLLRETSLVDFYPPEVFLVTLEELKKSNFSELSFTEQADKIEIICRHNKAIFKTPIDDSGLIQTYLKLQTILETGYEVEFPTGF